MQTGFGAGGQHNNPVYFARFSLAVVDADAVRTELSWEQEVLGIPNLDNRKVVYQNQQLDVIGLLGRDILRNCRMTYDGPGGILHVQFDQAALKLQPSRL